MQAGQIDEPLMAALYDAAVYAGDWQPALERFRTLLGSAETAVTGWAPGGPAAVGINLTGRLIPPEARTSYMQHYVRFDPKLPILAQHEPGFLFNDARHFDEHFVRRNPFYQEFSRPIGSRRTLHMVLSRAGEETIYLAAMRTFRQKPYDALVEDTFHRASRHFLQAVRLRQKFDASQLLADSARAALDSLKYGAIVLDRRGCVLIANRAAEKATAPGEPLQLRQQRFSARSARLAADLEALIRAALPPCPTAGALRAPRPDGTAWSIWIAPLPAQAPLSISGPAALALIGRPQRTLGVSCEELRTHYRLTRAEGELALALARGSSMEAAATERGVKISTARSQLLSILQKTGARGQADLLRMLAVLPSMALAVY